MSRLDYEIEVPFTENGGRRCAPACTKMILDHLLPDMAISKEQAEDLSGFREGRSTWAAQHLLSLNTLGLEIGWIQAENLPAFAANPEAFMLAQFGGNVEQYEAYAKTSDISLEGARVKEYLERQLPFDQREATRYDITSLALGGHVVRLELNGKALADQPGDVGHAVVVSGFSDTVIRLENPDGLYGSKPKQLVSWDKLDAAWDGYRALQYYTVAS